MKKYNAPFSAEQIKKFEEFDMPCLGRTDNGRTSEIFGLMISEMISQGEGRVAPDMLGAERFFLDEFITIEMKLEFEWITAEFLKHCYPELEAYKDIKSYNNDYPGILNDTDAMYHKVLDLIYNAAKAGNEYARELIISLYKTFHKREYNQLKRFGSLSVGEAEALSEYEDGEISYEAMGRILIMSDLLGIRQEESCSFLYMILDRERKQYDEWDNELIEYNKTDDSIFDECLETVSAWLEEDERTKKKRSLGCDKFRDIERLVGVSFGKHRLSETYADSCLGRGGIKHSLTRGLYNLKTAYPKRTFTFEDVQIYSHIVQLVDTIAKITEDYNYFIDCILKIEDPGRDDFFEFMFDPGKINVKGGKQKSEKKQAVVSHNAPVSVGDAVEKDYLSEISDLRQRLHAAEQDRDYYRRSYDDFRNEVKYFKGISEKQAAEHEELIVLRNYVYNLSMENEPHSDDKDELEKMQAEIRKHRVVLIGGHISWLNKLKKVFPDWVYVDTKSNSSVRNGIVNNADMVYFFTDYISHLTYGKFISVCRENGVAYSYLHTRNINELTRQVYRDLK
ncbi:MAG: hypothetical protein Q4E57_06600 [Eubacteriales bacterium]|nr:hypothetical protein [Eubacteriales bacterium]